MGKTTLIKLLAGIIQPDDENIEPPQVECKIALRNSTLKIVRAFSTRENQLKLKKYESKS